MVTMFLIALVLPTIGSNILNFQIRKFYPEEQYIRMRPPGRLIEKLKFEHSENKEVIKKIKTGLLLEKMGIIGIIGVFFLILLSSKLF
jgi:hypothetical protein